MKLSKKKIEQYHYRQTESDTTDCMWADFNIEDNGEAGRLSIHSDYGDWHYYWSSCGKPFKSFLLSINDSYLMGKLGKRTDFTPLYDDIKQDIVKAKEEKNITKAQAKECLDELELLIDDNPITESDFYHYLVNNCENLLVHIYGDDYDSIPHKRDFPPHLRMFVKEVWPEFKNTLVDEGWGKVVSK